MAFSTIKTIIYIVISTGTAGAKRRPWSGEILWVFDVGSESVFRVSLPFTRDARYRVSTSYGAFSCIVIDSGAKDEGCSECAKGSVPGRKMFRPYSMWILAIRVGDTRPCVSTRVGFKC